MNKRIKHLARPTRHVAMAMLMALAFIPSPARAQQGPPFIEASVSTRQVQVAEPFDINYTVHAPAGSKVVWPAVGEQLGAFDVLTHQDINDLPAPGDPSTRIWTRRYTLESITAGELQAPEFEVSVISDGTTRTVRARPLAMRVASTLEGKADPTKYRDIRSVIDLQTPAKPGSNRWLVWIGAAAGLVTLAGASLMFVARHRAGLTPAGLAHHRLKALRKRSGDSATLAAELSLVMRDYLATQFEDSYSKRTNYEWLETIQQRDMLSTPCVNKLKGLFESLDLAVYAGVPLSPAELEAMIGQAHQLIDEVTDEMQPRQPQKEAA